MRQRPRPPWREGMALLIVLVLIVMVALSAYSFTLMMQNQYLLSRVQEDQAQAKLAVLSGVDFVAALLIQPAAARSELGDVMANPELFQAVVVEDFPGNAAAQPSAWRFSVISPRSASGSSQWSGEKGISQESTGTQNFVFGLQSESSKVHLPTLAEWDRWQPGHARRVLMSLPGATEEVVNAWLNRLAEISSSHYAEQKLTGVHSPIPATLSSDSAPQNVEQPPVSLSPTSLPSQLAHNRISSRSDLGRHWFGDDLNHNYRLDPLESSLRSIISGESTQDSSGFESFSPSSRSTSGFANSVSSDNTLGWQQYLTWYSGCRNESMSGRPRIFLNSQNLQELHQRLTEIWPTEWVNFVIAYRQYGPSAGSPPQSRRSNRATATKTDPESLDTTPDFSVPPSFSIVTPLEMIGAMVRIPQKHAVEDGTSRYRMIQSPFQDEILSASDYLGRLLDDVTTISTSSFHGRIDVNRAPEMVLMAVPGIERDLAERIVQHRQDKQQNLATTDSQSNDYSGQMTIAWLFERGLVDLPQLARLEPYLTARSDIYSCQIVGYKDENHAVYRATLTVDACGSVPVIRNFRTWHDWDRGFDLHQFQTHHD